MRQASRKPASAGTAGIVQAVAEMKKGARPAKKSQEVHPSLAAALASVLARYEKGFTAFSGARPAGVRWTRRRIATGGSAGKSYALQAQVAADTSSLTWTLSAAAARVSRDDERSVGEIQAYLQSIIRQANG